MKNTTALLMALGLTLPAMTLAQDSDQSRPPRGDRPALRDGASGDQPNRPPRRDGAAGNAERGPGNRDGAGPGGPGGAGQRPMVPPLFAALDTNHDGVLDEEEIKNAAESLRKLDKNGDGKLTPDELRPQRPDGAGAGGPPQDGNREGVAPRGDRSGPADGQRPPRREARPPEGQ